MDVKDGKRLQSWRSIRRGINLHVLSLLISLISQTYPTSHAGRISARLLRSCDLIRYHMPLFLKISVFLSFPMICSGLDPILSPTIALLSILCYHRIYIYIFNMSNSLGSRIFREACHPREATLWEICSKLFKENIVVSFRIEYEKK